MHEFESIPNAFSDPLFTRLFMLAEINNFTSEEYRQYQKSLENMSEFDNIVNSTAELSETRGRELEKLEIAKKSKLLGIADDVISQVTGLPLETIQNL